MKILKLSLISLFTIGLTACKKDVKTTDPSKDSLAAKKDSVVVPEVYKEYYGIYMGDFAGK